MLKYYNNDGVLVNVSTNYRMLKDYCYEYGGSVRTPDGTILFSM